MKEVNYFELYRKKNNQIKVLIIVFAVLALLSGIGYTYMVLRQTLLAPKITEISQLGKYREGTVVQIETARYYYTGFIDSKQEKEVASYYFLAPNDTDEFVMFRGLKKYYDDEWGTVRVFRGVLEYDKYRSENVDKLAEGLEVDRDTANNKLWSLQINEEIDGGPYFLVIVPLGFIALIVAFYFSGMKRNKKHYERLREFIDPATADTQARSDFEQGSFSDFGRLSISKSWIFNRLMTDLYLYPSDEIVWTYMLVTQHRVNGIPSGKTYQCLFYLTDGTVLTYNGTQRDIDEIIEFAKNNWLAYVGYTDEMKAAYFADKAAFVAEWKKDKGLTTE